MVQTELEVAVSYAPLNVNGKSDNFPDELPSTASDVNYYRYYNGFGKFGCGVSFTLNQEENAP